MSTDQCKTLLKSHELSVTQPRMAVLDTFLAQNRALSLPELEELLPATDRATIYRTLNVFEQNGLLHQVAGTSSRSQYALSCRGGHAHSHTTHTHQHTHAHHLHFNCTVCGATTCLDSIAIPAMPVLPAGYVVQHLHVVLDGVCPQCSASRAN